MPTESNPPGVEDTDLDDPRFDHLLEYDELHLRAGFGQFRSEWARGFRDSQRTHRPPVAGEYRFKIQRHRLKTALETTELTIDTREAFNKVRVEISRTRLKLATFDQRSFSVVTIPLEEPSPSFPAESEQAVTFIFEHDLLLRITRRLPEELAIVEFTYVVATQLLRFQTWESEEPLIIQKNFQLSCWPLSAFRAEIPLNPPSLGRVDTIIPPQSH